MILRELRIDGFGLHHDLSLELSPGLNLVTGPNEAGKTTLHAFVRGMLHGFPTGRSAESKHPPLAGGVHGGTLVVEADEGRFAIHRAVGGRRTLRVEGPDGREGGEALLRALLRNVDAPLYRSVFAFGLDELADLSGLTGSEMELRLFDTSLSGAGRSATALVGELELARDAELSARKGRVRELAGRLDELDLELKAARSRSRQYRERLDAEADGAARLEALKALLRTARADVARRDALVALWPQELRRREAEGVLAELPPERNGDARTGEVLARLDALDGRLRDLEMTGAAAEREAERLGHTIEALRPDPRLVGLEGRVKGLLREARLQADRRERLPALAATIHRHEETAAALFASLGPGWSEDRARAIDRSLPRREIIERFGARLRELERRRAEASALEARARSELERASAELAQRRDALNAIEEPPTLAALDRQGGALAELRAARLELEGAARRLDELGAAPTAGGALPPAGALPWVGAAAFLAVALAALVRGEWAVGAVAGAAALAFLAFGIQKAKGAKAGASRGQSRAEAERRLAAIEAAIDAHARAAGLGGEASAAAIEAAAEALGRYRLSRTRWDDRQDDLRRSKVAEELAARECRRAEEALAAADEAAGALHGEWIEHVGDLAGAGGPFGPETAREHLLRLDEAVQAVDARAREQAEHRRIADAVWAWEEAVAAVLGEAGTAAESATSGARGASEEGLARLSASLEAEQKRGEERRLLESRQERLREEAEVARREIERLEAERRELLSEAGVEDRAGLARRVDEARRREAALQERRSAGRAIDETLGSGEDAAAARAALETGEKARWEDERVLAVAAVEEGEAEVEALARELALLRREREELERSGDVPRLSAEREQVQTELSEAARRWRKAVLLRQLLLDSLEELRRERQPAVLRHAGEAFARITGGRYVGVLQTVEGDGVEVLDGRGRRVPASALSRGTREQLYVCVRLGLVAAFAEQGTRLPLLMDDVVANFDPERAAATAAVLADFAGAHQVLFFTCHPHTAERLLSVDPSARHLALAPSWSGAGPADGRPALAAS
ncbi:AAA family ATPase [Vulgatibacter incomptus]|uniref:DNA double-strand break repair Rad50 ATPase n=1 Tax=Vulgatibacter incomptus TaxID=1391653 RepID=A0A0K1PF22_9BACT|nr:AAA family ATPase [Vulgatibacter incomptus]AKU92021.1 DNA double-strand break repair Rad50 ATPase [Vulgatibacter incomptus]